jgi:hypothetical protein
MFVFQVSDMKNGEEKKGRYLQIQMKMKRTGKKKNEK